MNRAPRKSLLGLLVSGALIGVLAVGVSGVAKATSAWIDPSYQEICQPDYAEWWLAWSGTPDFTVSWNDGLGYSWTDVTSDDAGYAYHDVTQGGTFNQSLRVTDHYGLVGSASSRLVSKDPGIPPCPIR
jgi:hypothetical protein